MEALLNLTQTQDIFEHDYKNYAYGMLPFADKPQAAYYIDQLAAQGCQTIYIAITDQTQRITKQLGYGSFWSLTIHYLNINKKIGLNKFLTLQARGIHEITLPYSLATNYQNSNEKSKSNLIDNYIAEQINTLNNMEGFQMPSYQVRPNVFLSEGAKTRAMPDFPIHLGKYSELKNRCVFRGPAVIGENSVVEQGNTLDNTIVMPNTYVGSNLDLSNCLVTSKWIYHQITKERINIDAAELLSAA